MNTGNEILTCYEQGQTILQGMATSQLVKNDTIFANWIENSSYFWYVRELEGNKEIRLVNPKSATNTLVLDYKTLVKELSRVHPQFQSLVPDPEHILLQDVSMSLSPIQFHFKALNKNWVFEHETAQCREAETFNTQDHELVSPDGSKAIFLRGHNIWLRDKASGEEHALTQEGDENNSYARPSIWDEFPGLDSTIQAAWSPDSKKIFTIQLDSQNLSTRPVINYCPEDGDCRPRVEHVTNPYPGDENIETLRLLIIDTETGGLLEVDYGPLTYFYYTERLLGFFTNNMGWWSNSGQHAYFIDLARGSQAVRIVKLDAQAGTTQVLHEETSDTFIKLRHCDQDPVLFLPLSDTDELIWFSEHTNWGHLYLYDLNTGQFKHQITEGPWLVRNILHYDSNQRELLLQTAARDTDISPYYRDVCKVNIDSGTITSIAAGNFEYVVHKPLDPIIAAFNMTRLASEHTSGVSPDGQYVVATRSRVDSIPETVLIDRNGKEILSIEHANVSNLPAGWQWPEPVKLTSNDAKTDLYGVVFRPPSFSPDRSYPVIDFFYSYRGFSGLPQGSFSNNYVFGYAYFLAAALAAVGFIVVMIEGRGTPLRDKPFQAQHFGNPTCNGNLEDRIAGIRELANKYPYMDLERVGISAVETPNNAIYGLINYSHFYKVAVLHCLLDSRFAIPSQTETHECLFSNKIETELRYPAENIQSFSGKLLLIQGMRAATTAGPMFQLVDALEKANKDFDMLCLPNLYNAISAYTIRREWDYHVRHLQKIEPPCEFSLITGFELLNNNFAEQFI